MLLCRKVPPFGAHTLRMPKTLCVYCSSSDRLDKKYASAAEALGRVSPMDQRLQRVGRNVIAIE